MEWTHHHTLESMLVYHHSMAMWNADCMERRVKLNGILGAAITARCFHRNKFHQQMILSFAGAFLRSRQIRIAYSACSCSSTLCNVPPVLTGECVYM